MGGCASSIGAACLALLVGAQAAQAGASAPSGRGSEPVVHYQVRRGDTLYGLASKYLVRLGDAEAVGRANHVRDPHRLPVGSDLAIPVAWLRTESIEAVVEGVGGSATVTSKGKSAVLTKGAVLHEGETVSTGANTFVRLGLPDGTHVALPSQSRLRIEALRRILLTGALDRTFNVETGRAEAIVIPMRQPQDRFLLKTPLSIAAVRGTDFRVSFDTEAQRASVGVLEGTVGVAPPAASDTATAVHKSFGVSAEASGVSPPRALLHAPTLKNSSRVQQGPAVTLDLEPVANAAIYRVQVAADAGMLNPVAEIQGDQPTLVLPPIADGDWFVKLTAIDGGGLEGAPSIYGFERILNNVGLKSPSSLGKKRTAHWNFTWESQSGQAPPTYRFQLFGDAENAPPVIDEPGLTSPQISVTGLADGVFHWRVQSTLIKDGRTYETWSPLQEFRIGR